MKSAVLLILAAGLTYEKHIEDTGEKVDPQSPLIFSKNLRSAYYVKSGEVGSVRIPTDAEVYSELGKIEAGLPEKLKSKFEVFPKMLDYEGELGIYFLKNVTLKELQDPGTTELRDSIGYFAANDLSLRSLQVLADKDPKKYEYWSAAKSFERFLPMSEVQKVPTFSLTKWEPITVETWVDNETKPRQSSNLTETIYSPRQYLLAAAKASGGTIVKGTVLLTGSATGTVFHTPKFKKWIAEFLGFDRFRKLSIVSGNSKVKYLEPGSKVTVKVGGAGSVSIVISK